MKKYIPPLNVKFLTPFYDIFCRISGFGDKFRNKIISHLNPKHGMHILDLGCGTGVDDRLILRQYPHVNIVGVDPDKDAIAIAKRNSQNIKYVIGYATNLPFENNRFDIVISTLVFHHLPTESKKEAMKEAYRVLKPGGLFLLTDLGKSKNKFWALLSWISLLEEGKDNIEGKIPLFMTEAGFKNVEIIDEPRRNVFTTKAVK